jgi:hypothetical protein
MPNTRYFRASSWQSDVKPLKNPPDLAKLDRRKYVAPQESLATKMLMNMLQHVLWKSGFSDRMARKIAETVPPERLAALRPITTKRSLEIICQIYDIINYVEELTHDQREVQRSIEEYWQSVSYSVRHIVEDYWRYLGKE